VTVYKGLKMTEAQPNDWVVVSGVGGHAQPHGLGVLDREVAEAAVDIDDEKLALATKLGAELTVNAAKADPAAFITKGIGGAQGVLVTAVSTKAFAQAMGMVARGGTVSLNGLPAGDFPLSIFDTVLNGVTVRGSIVGTRLDLQEAFEFAAAGKVAATVSTDTLENINAIFERMRRGEIEGRVVLDFQGRRAA
jgi:propanol-preferring alcohol dehydrogenase